MNRLARLFSTDVSDTAAAGTPSVSARSWAMASLARPSLGRHGDPDLEGVAVAADHLRPAGARLRVDAR